MPQLVFLLGVLITIGGCSSKIERPVSSSDQIRPVVNENVTRHMPRNHTPSRAVFKKGGKWRGFNALQTSKVAWNNPGARQSLLNMVNVGANSVAVVVFLKQNGPSSTDIRVANNVTMGQLTAAIETAHQLGLKVVVKPQILVRGSWAGAISFSNSNQMQSWFRNYSSHLLQYARLSQRLGVEAFVIGTELKGIARDLPWLELIAQLRREFRGILTYAAHNVDGVENFPYWYKLDVIGVSLYPELGDMGEYDEMLTHVEHSMYKLGQAIKNQRTRTVWLLEIGMPSAEGYSSMPWEWKSLHKKRDRVDLTMQTGAVAAWLNVINRTRYVDGVFFWSWYSDPYAGGAHDLDYTVQNKPAEIMIRQYWRN